TVTRNNINKVLTTATGGYGGRGITVGTGSSASNITIANNEISGVNGSNYSSFGSSSSMGISIGVIGNSSALTTVAGGIDIYHNSINMYGAYSYTTNCITAALYAGSSASNLKLVNNIFTNSMNNTNASGTASKNYAVYSVAGAGAYSVINSNDYFVSGSQGVLGFLGSDLTTLAQIRTATGQDLSSYSITPNFASDTDLHLVAGTNDCLDNGGVGVGIAVDFDGQSRSTTTPDIGADEFSSTTVFDITATEISGTTPDDAITCTGDPVTLGITNGSVITWSTGETTPTISVAPSSTTTYSVTISLSGICTKVSSVTINVNSLPTPSVSATETSGITDNDGVTCPGSSATLTAAGGTSYVWNNGASTTSITVAPTSTTTYTVTATDGNNCSNSATGTVTVLDPPALSVTKVEPTTCVSTDGSIDLTVSPAGAYTYVWSTGATTEDINGLPFGAYFVTVTSTSTNCSASLAVALLGPGGCGNCPFIPALTMTPSPSCTGSSVNMTTSGLTDMGITYGITFVSFPAPAGNPYSGGTVLATVDNASLTGSATTASADYTFNTTGTNFVYAILTPTPTDPVCRPFAQANHIVNQTPTASIAVAETSGNTNNDGTICATASATLTASGGATYVWSNGESTDATTVSPAVTTTYTVTVTSAAGCTATASTTITVNPLPTPSVTVTETSGVSGNDGTICAGASATLTAGGGTSYLW
ncbi:MAG: beta strand repeat-containing protein, partial [Bacteroidota bacterium]